MNELRELREELAEKQQLYRQIFTEAASKGDDGEETHDLSQVECLGKTVNELEGGEKSKRVAEIAGDIKDEIDALDERIATMEAVSGFRTTEQHFKQQRRRPSFSGGGENKGARFGERLSVKQISQRVVSDDTFKAWQRGSRDGRIEIDAYWSEAKALESKTLMSTTAGWPPEVTRNGVVVDTPLRPPQIIDIMPPAQTGQNSIAFMQQTTRTQAAAEVAEGGLKPEAALAFAEATKPVREIAVHIPVTDIQLEDAPFISSLIETMLREDVNERLDRQIVEGNGLTSNLEGILNTTGIQTISGTGKDPFVSVLSAQTSLRTGAARAVPTHIILNPADWEKIASDKDSNGRFRIGNPQQITDRRLWGLPVIENEVVPADTALVGSFMARNVQLVERRGIVVERGMINDQFIRDQQTIRATVRMALAVYRPAAFITITDFDGVV